MLLVDWPEQLCYDMTTLVKTCDMLQDSEGAYYWHITSGTIQRHPPVPEDGQVSLSRPRCLLQIITSNIAESFLIL